MHPRSITFAALFAATAVGLVARASVPPDVDWGSSTETTAWLGELELEAKAVDEEPSVLGYLAPRGCVEVYTVKVTEHMADEVARFYNRRPEVSDAVLALAPHDRPGADLDPDGLPVTRTVAWLESEDIGVRPYASQAPTPAEQRRDAFVSARGIGPGAPDAACRNRAWDPIEDALALGWPWLPLHRLSAGDSWSGARVEGHCNETACLSPDGVAGPKAHDRSCVTPPWTERLVETLEIGGDRFAAIESTWRDRDDLDEIDGGITTTRHALVSGEHHRLTRARITVQHRWSGIERRVDIDSIDACPGSLAAAGWQRPATVVAQAEAAAHAVSNPESGRN